MLTAAAGNGAVNGTYTLSVSQTAKNGTASISSLATTYTAASDVINPNIVNGGGDDDFTVDVGLGSDQVSVTIELTNTTTLDSLATQLNAEFDTNGGVATASTFERVSTTIDVSGLKGRSVE